MNEKLAIVIPVFNEPEIGKTLESLYAQNFDDRDVVHHFIIDNGSTDNTRALIEQFTDEHDEFPATIVEESQKGTGAACDTGFKTALSKGYTIVARTDADTQPAPDWTNRITGYLSNDQSVQLLGGRTLARRDEYYRLGDDLLLPFAINGARVALSVRNRNLNYLKAINGANMATRSAVYEQVGGFDRTSINEKDEDIAYSLKIVENFGKQAVRVDPKLKVQTSMRRIRKNGLVRTALHHLFPEKRTGNVDVR